MTASQKHTFGSYREFFAHHLAVLLYAGGGLLLAFASRSNEGGVGKFHVFIFCGLIIYLWFHLRNAVRLDIGSEGITVKRLVNGNKLYYPFDSLSSIGYTPPADRRHGVECARIFINTLDGTTNRYVLPVSPGRRFEDMVELLQQSIKTEDITWW